MTKKTDKYTVPEEILEKHKFGIELARNYWVLNLPTGISDEDFDKIEKAAREDGLELRDYVYQEIQGTRYPNAPYITKIEKTQVQGSMMEAVREFTEQYRQTYGEDIFWIPKYDGSSLAGYYDTTTGRCIRVITVGGSNLGSDGIDQTKKFSRYFPELPNTGICAIQAECLIALEHGFGESSRQKANGLVNSKYMEDQVDCLAGIRGFRYFLDPSCPMSIETAKLSYRDIMCGLVRRTYNMSGDCKFSGGYVMTLEDLENLGEEVVNKDIWKTDTGTFLVDGLVAYTYGGVCLQALKYKDAGRGEASEVLSIKWNNQITKGKDSWSANAIINPVVVRGSKCTKPTVGSIKKMVDTGLSKGAKVTIILANSTIPQVSNVIEKGNLDYEWPTCSCGHKMGSDDIFGALLKCGNPDCSERFGRMISYLGTCQTFYDIDLNKLLIIDRFKWEEKTDLSVVMPDLEKIIQNNLGAEEFNNYLKQYLKTDLQKRNLDLITLPAYKSLLQYVTGNNQGIIQ